MNLFTVNINVPVIDVSCHLLSSHIFTFFMDHFKLSKACLIKNVNIKNNLAFKNIANNCLLLIASVYLLA